MVKTIDLTHLYRHTLQQFFFPFIKPIKKSKTKNCKLKLLSNTMFCISVFWTGTFRVQQSDSVYYQASKVFFQIDLHILVVYFCIKLMTTSTNCNGHRYRCSSNIPPSFIGSHSLFLVDFKIYIKHIYYKSQIII